MNKERKIFWQKRRHPPTRCVYMYAYISLTSLYREIITKKINSIDWLKKEKRRGKKNCFHFLIRSTSSSTFVWESWRDSWQLNVCCSIWVYRKQTKKLQNLMQRVELYPIRRWEKGREKELNFHHQDHLTLFHQKNLKVYGLNVKYLSFTLDSLI